VRPGTDATCTIRAMTIATGLSALKAAADLVRALRDAAKAGSLKPDEFAGRIAEVYDYITDSKEAVLCTEEEISQLKAENERLKTFVFHHSVSWRTLADGTEDGPFCPVCLGEGVNMRLALNATGDQTGGVLYFRCPKTHVPPGKGREPSYPVPKELVPENRYFVRGL
jgi:hypothetical protein